MPAVITFRALAPTDGPAFAALFAASPDGGDVEFTSWFHIDPYAALLAGHSHTEGVTALTATGEMVGFGLVTHGRCQVNGSERPYALLNALKVNPHPSCLRPGRLSAWIKPGCFTLFNRKAEPV